MTVAKKAIKPRGGKRAKAGRPPGSVTLKNAIARLGVDPALVDPARILSAIAVDEAAPASARVAACRELMAIREKQNDSTPGGSSHNLIWERPANA
jgi:hypothetical protein